MMNVKEPMGILTALGVGIGVMYLFDPNGGVRRRAIMGDKLLHYVRTGTRVADIVSRDLAHRTQGIVAVATHLLRPADVSRLDDGVLIARVRSRMGRLVSHPHAIEVHAEKGHITLSGPIFTDEQRHLIRAVLRMRGVRKISNCLEGHRRGEQVARLAGGKSRSVQPIDVFQRSWSPASRFVIGSGAILISLYGMRRQDLRGVAVSGLALLAGLRALTNREARELLSAAPLRGEQKQRPEPKPKPAMHEVQVAKTWELEPAPVTKPKAA
ncbi:MAG: BON domain-containing protein [Deltaproteobacteria bacterium]|nr:BON domain-containing protein [Deltaproteobacteria bacterium]